MHNELVLEATKQMTILPYSFQERALQFIKELNKEVASPKKTGVSGNKLLKYAGTIAPDDLQIMRDSIASDCSRIDTNEW